MKENGSDLIISGTNLELTGAMKQNVREKMQKLFDHETKIIRLRVDLRREFSKSTGEPQFIAKGHIEIRGNDRVASVASDDLYKSIDLLVNKLDRMLRRRSRLRVLKRKQTHAVEIPAELPKVG